MIVVLRVGVAGDLLQHVDVVMVPLILEFFEGNAGGFDGEQVDSKDHCVDRVLTTLTIARRGTAFAVIKREVDIFNCS